MDNISQQTDEIEALSSIYVDEFMVEGQNYFSMKVTSSVTLFIRMQPDYPSDSPPKYDLLAPELSREQKYKVDKEFDLIFEENKGNPILFQWIEKLKEIALTKPKKAKEPSGNSKHSRAARKMKESSPPVVSNIIDIEKFAKGVVHGPTIEDRRSVFQGHVCAITSEEDVKNLLDYLKQNKKIAQASHNIYAYRTRQNSIVHQDCDDDGENHASKRLLHLLQLLNLEGVMVVVSRWYGGIQLGPDRFKHITNAARQALVNGNFIK